MHLRGCADHAPKFHLRENPWCLRDDHRIAMATCSFVLRLGAHSPGLRACQAVSRFFDRVCRSQALDTTMRQRVSVCLWVGCLRAPMRVPNRLRVLVLAVIAPGCVSIPPGIYEQFEAPHPAEHSLFDSSRSGSLRDSGTPTSSASAVSPPPSGSHPVFAPSSSASGPLVSLLERPQE